MCFVARFIRREARDNHTLPPEKLELKAIRAILIKCNREDRRPMAFDDLQIVEKVW
jgi:hypothetical protein